MNNYFIVDIETVPNNIENYFFLSEEKKLELLNPIDSKIWALGIRHNEVNKLFYGHNEKEILTQFWSEWNLIMEKNAITGIVGFSINNFDIPFIIARSFIHGVKIRPFTLKQVIDLREKINAYRYGKTRGRLKEYAALIGLDVLETDGSQVPKLWHENKLDELRKYLEKDLEITASLYKRSK